MNRRLALTVTLLLIGTLPPARSAMFESTCEAPAHLREALAALDPVTLDCHDQPCMETGLRRAEALLHRHAHDFHARRAYITLARLAGRAGSRESALVRRRAGLAAEEGALNAEDLHLASLLKPANDAARLNERALALDPSFPWAHLGLAESLGQQGETEKASAELEAFIQECPGRFQEPMSRPSSVAGPSLLARHLPRWRDALASGQTVERLAYLPRLWRAEFVVSPPAEHDRVRTRIGETLVLLERERRIGHLRWWRTLIEGYGLSRDDESLARAEAGLVEHFPCEPDAVRVRIRSWSDRVTEVDASRLQPTEAGRLLGEASGWTAQCPRDQMYARFRFLAAGRAEGLSSESLRREAHRYLRTWERDPNRYHVYHEPPYDVAMALLLKDVDPHRIPALVDRERRSLQEERRELPLERLRGASRDVTGYNRLCQDFDLAILLGRAWLRLGLPGKATAEGESASRIMDALLAHPRANPESDADLRFRKWTLDAQLAEAQGRSEDAERLRAMAAQAGSIPSETTTGWERADEPLPPFELTDLEGRAWRSADLGGSTVLISFWATWCAPCRLELQSVQRLADQAGSDPSIRVLTLNADANPGLVAPFVQKERLHLPVLLAEAYWRTALKDRSLPRAWIVSPGGRIVYALSGFRPETHARWEEQTAALLKGLAAAPR